MWFDIAKEVLGLNKIVGATTTDYSTNPFGDNNPDGLMKTPTITVVEMPAINFENYVTQDFDNGLGPTTAWVDSPGLQQQRMMPTQLTVRLRLTSFVRTSRLSLSL